ncbi:MAG: hypothetical protein MR991_06420 [Clostridiales bacterium]|nr:hypothetical protein [Clostridiales bacterium]MDY2920872.1 hypothetical protein [Lentihominibacter sp.]
MKIKDRLSHIRAGMEDAMERGATAGDRFIYESSIAEIRRVGRWLKEQCSTECRLYTETDGDSQRQYIEFRNTTGMDFRFFAMEVIVLREEREVDSFEVMTAGWRNGETARLYLARNIGSEDVLSFNPDSVEYQVMR